MIPFGKFLEFISWTKGNIFAKCNGKEHKREKIISVSLRYYPNGHNASNYILAKCVLERFQHPKQHSWQRYPLIYHDQSSNHYSYIQYDGCISVFLLNSCNKSPGLQWLVTFMLFKTAVFFCASQYRLIQLQCLVVELPHVLPLAWRKTCLGWDWWSLLHIRAKPDLFKLSCICGDKDLY